MIITEREFQLHHMTTIAKDFQQYKWYSRGHTLLFHCQCCFAFILYSLLLLFFSLFLFSLLLFIFSLLFFYLVIDI